MKEYFKCIRNEAAAMINSTWQDDFYKQMQERHGEVIMTSSELPQSMIKQNSTIGVREICTAECHFSTHYL